MNATGSRLRTEIRESMGRPMIIDEAGHAREGKGGQDSLSVVDQEENMKLQFPAYDALYDYCRSKLSGSVGLENPAK